MADLPKQCEVVVIGGGVIGCSVAYHLAQAGFSEVVLLERQQLTSGTTWHAAGLVGQLRTSINMTKLAKYTSELYRGLEEETGQATGYRQCGSVSIAATSERFEELKRSASMARVFDLEVNVVDVDQIGEMYPLINTADLHGGIHIPSDGYANAVDITQALAKGARSDGVEIFQNTLVTEILRDGDRVTGVVTENATINANHVVIQRARQHLFGKHPLLAETPEEWNNIPICLTEAIVNIIKTTIESDESLFDYQMKTNDRLYRLQAQISAMRDRNTASIQKTAQDATKRIDENQAAVGRSIQ